MRRRREAVESVVLVLAILASAAALSRLGAHAGDGPKEGCPICGGHAADFQNTPEGVFDRFKAAYIAGDAEMAKECVTSSTDETWEAFRDVQRGMGLAPLLRFCVVDCATSGDEATLTVAHLGEKSRMELQARRLDGVWRLDLGEGDWLPAFGTRLLLAWAPGEGKSLEEARLRATARDCKNNLRQLGTYIVMYVCKYGSDRFYSGPGIRLFTDLFNLPTPKQAIAASQHGLLLCKAAGDTWDEAREAALRTDDPACTSYECIDATVSDATTQPSWPVAWDKAPHPDGKRNVLFFSGVVEEMTDEAFQEALKAWPHRKK